MDDSVVRDRAINLFRYLSALAELRAKKIRDVASYERVFWFHELPRERECSTPAWPERQNIDSDQWLRIEKPARPSLPQPPVECDHWSDAGTLEDVATEPTLRSEIVDPNWIVGAAADVDAPDVPPTRLLLAEHPRVAAAWETYIRTQWRPWRLKHQRWESIQSPYRKLFAIYQEQQRRGEQYELVVGVGMFLWMNSTGQRVCRPAVTVRAAITLERETGCITVGPVAEGADITLEQDMLEVNECPPYQDQPLINQQLSDLETLWERSLIVPILKGWLQTLRIAADAEYDDGLKPPDRATSIPYMTFAPILILRKRGERTMREALKKIVKRIAEGDRVPDGIRHLCGEHADADGSIDERCDGSDVPDSILFPLPTNGEQLAIVRRLKGRSGVLVQGPPGTGKSHTIVNLVSHFLACGKRVLVTSQTPRALKVLREKFPETIRALTVSLLADDAESRANLEYAVQGILRHCETSDPENSRTKIGAKNRERETYKSELSRLTRSLREIRESETILHSIPGTPYSGTAQEIAKRLSCDASRYSWLVDSVVENAEPPLTDSEFDELLALWAKFGTEISSVAASELPELDSLPTSESFEAAVRELRLANEAAAAISGNPASNEGLIKQLAALEKPALEELCRIAQEAIQCAASINRKKDPWIERAWSDVLSGHVTPWLSRESVTTRAISSLAKLPARIADAELDTQCDLSNTRLVADATNLLSHLENGGRFGVWVFRNKCVKDSMYLWQRCRFDGKRCDEPAVLRSLIANLEARETLDRAWREWGDIVKVPEGTFRHRAACLQQCRNILRAVLRFNSFSAAAANILANIDGHEAITANKDWAVIILANAKCAIATVDQDNATSVVQELARRVSECCNLRHSPVADLVAAAWRADADGYRLQIQRLRKQHEARSSARCGVSLREKLHDGAPLLSMSIQNPEAVEVLSRAGSLEAAWAWRRGCTWLVRFANDHSPNSIDREISQVEAQLHAATESLVAQRAWSCCMKKLDADRTRRGALKAWQLKVQQIGKGTGKHAETYRRDARKYMQRCRDAIPAWIMPVHRVVEQIEMEPEVFDVVIVDEASQTGPEGLILQYLGKQCIIVGDDKQISPEAGFVDAAQVRELIHQYLADDPFGTTLDLGTSLFNQAAIRFDGRITLREHFRCMPEIIRFSNALCYRETPLIPLRQYGPSRLPPLQVRFVVDGYREGDSQNAINRPEAAAIVKTVVECLNDPLYRDKSIGVICLQGHAQAQCIEAMILDKVGAEPFKDEKRRLLCGDPYSFQGDERDVVFLSMVASADGEGRSAPLLRKAFEQRFNVAASRARDQMWLFHSVRESDLHPDCMRRRLLDFFYSPDADETSDDDSYGSDFERDVAADLRLAGFRVTSQFEVAGRRIDLVVHGGDRRVAVECDGDEWHGPDQYEADVARQRMLERCGWTFLRLRGSAYYANRQRAVSELIEALATLGVTPTPSRDSRSTMRDWAAEISGNECLEALGRYTVDTAEENVSEQLELATGQSDVSNVFPVPSAGDETLDDSPNEERISESNREPLLFANGSVPVAPTNDASGGAIADIVEVASIDSQRWFEIAKWAKKNDLLEPWQRGLAYSLGVIARQGVLPTSRQARQGKRILAEAMAYGFSCSTATRPLFDAH